MKVSIVLKGTAYFATITTALAQQIITSSSSSSSSSSSFYSSSSSFSSGEVGLISDQPQVQDLRYGGRRQRGGYYGSGPIGGGGSQVIISNPNAGIGFPCQNGGGCGVTETVNVVEEVSCQCDCYGQCRNPEGDNCRCTTITRTLGGNGQVRTRNPAPTITNTRNSPSRSSSVDRSQPTTGQTTFSQTLPEITFKKILLAYLGTFSMEVTYLFDSARL